MATNITARKLIPFVATEAKTLSLPGVMQARLRAWVLIGLWREITRHYTLRDAGEDGIRMTYIAADQAVQRLLVTYGERPLEETLT